MQDVPAHRVSQPSAPRSAVSLPAPLMLDGATDVQLRTCVAAAHARRHSARAWAQEREWLTERRRAPGARSRKRRRRPNATPHRRVSAYTRKGGRRRATAPCPNAWACERSAKSMFAGRAASRRAVQPAGPTPAAPRDNIKAQRATSVLFSGQCMAFVSSTAHCAQCACSALAFVAARVQCKQLEQGRLSAFLSGGERSNSSVEGVAIVAAAGHSSAILPPQSDSSAPNTSSH